MQLTNFSPLYTSSPKLNNNNIARQEFQAIPGIYDFFWYGVINCCNLEPEYFQLLNIKNITQFLEICSTFACPPELFKKTVIRFSELVATHRPVLTNSIYEFSVVLENTDDKNNVLNYIDLYMLKYFMLLVSNNQKTLIDSPFLKDFIESLFSLTSRKCFLKNQRRIMLVDEMFADNKYELLTQLSKRFVFTFHESIVYFSHMPRESVLENEIIVDILVSFVYESIFVKAQEFNFNNVVNFVSEVVYKSCTTNRYKNVVNFIHLLFRKFEHFTRYQFIQHKRNNFLDRILNYLFKTDLLEKFDRENIVKLFITTEGCFNIFFFLTNLSYNEADLQSILDKSLHLPNNTPSMELCETSVHAPPTSKNFVYNSTATLKFCEELKSDPFNSFCVEASHNRNNWEILFKLVSVKENNIFNVLDCYLIKTAYNTKIIKFLLCCSTKDFLVLVVDDKVMIYTKESVKNRTFENNMCLKLKKMKKLEKNDIKIGGGVNSNCFYVILKNTFFYLFEISSIYTIKRKATFILYGNKNVDIEGCAIDNAEDFNSFVFHSKDFIYCSKI